jgi:hypothetical protein
MCYNYRVQLEFGSYDFPARVKHGLDPFYYNANDLK